MNEQQFAAAEAMHHALSNVPCICQHNIPYEGSQVVRFVTKQCARCRTMAQWERVRAAVLPKVTALECTLGTLLDEATNELFEVTRDPGRSLAQTERVRASIKARAAAVAP